MPFMLMILFLVVLAFALANGAWMMRRLEQAHPAIWSALGRPTFTLSTGIQPRLALVRFVWLQRYRELGDTALARCCQAAMIAEPLLVVLLALLVAGAG
jgi:hypothetical protein